MPRTTISGCCLCTSVVLALATASTCTFSAAVTPDAAAAEEQEGKAPPKLATFGGGIDRNMVNLVDKDMPTTWSVGQGKQKNVKWVADLGNVCHTSPVVYRGRVFVGTDNGRLRDPDVTGKRKAVLMCFAEKDGDFLWQNVHDMPEGVIHDTLREGLCSTPTAEGDFVYYCTPACEVVCAEAKDGKIAWRYDMAKELGVWAAYASACSPLVVDDMVFVLTGNGVDSNFEVVAPKAPSFIAVNKQNGKLVWQNNLPGNKIIGGQWASAVYADVKGKPQVIFPGGDGFLYSFEPKSGSLIWKFKCTPTQVKGVDRGRPQILVATPVVQGNRLYVAVGGYPDAGDLPNVGHMYCIDITKSGDVSCKNENYDPKDAANKDSGLVWHFGGQIKPAPKGLFARRVHLSWSASTVAVHDGLVYLAEGQGFLHCLDANTGQQYWVNDFNEQMLLGSPYLVDGKIYVCTQTDRSCHVFKSGKTLQPLRADSKKLSVGIDMHEGLESTPVAANGVLFITTHTKLYAIGRSK